jgi:hypothetical protein
VVKKSAKSDRQAKIDAIRNKQKGAEKARGAAIVGVCVLVALVIVGAAAYRPVTDWWEQRKFDNLALDSIGAAASTCQDVVTKKADGNQQHEATGTQITYPDAPPAFGAHWNEAGVAPAAFTRKFYTAADRPELEALVHNLEHGYTIMWYDDTVADDEGALDEIRGIARKFAGTSNLRNKFIAAPWTAADTEESGTGFPDGEHVAFSHWSAGGEGETDVAKQVGAWQYCSEPSGAALDAFMKQYPYFDSPEPNGA